MNKLIRNVTLCTLGLLLTAASATAGQFVKSIVATPYSQAWDFGTVYVPSGTIVSYFAVHSPSGYAFVHATAPGVIVDCHASGGSNGSNGGYQTTTGAGAVEFYLEAGSNDNDSSSCGVTLVW
jgi:hypothetical protein